MHKIMTIFLVLVFMAPLYSLGEEKIIIAVASDGNSMKDAVSQVAARCPFFLLVDGKGELLEAVSNPYKDTRGGSGASAANFLAERNVTMVIAENFGTKMKNALKTMEIKYFEFEGTAEEAVREILEEKDKT